MRESPGLSRRFFVAGSAACAALPGVASAQAPAQLTLGTAPIDSGMTPIIAQRAGFYKRYGLDIDIQVMNSGAAVSAAVVGGALKIGSTSLMGLIQAHTKGIPFQIVTPAAAYRTQRPSDVLLVRSDSPIKTAADLNGKTIASPALHDLLAVTTMAWIDQHGGDSKTVHQVELPPSATPVALSTGRIDAAAVSEPRVSEMLRTGDARVLGKPYDVIAEKFLISGFFAQPDVINANRNAFERLARAHHDANVFANANPKLTAPWLAEIAHLDESAVLRGTRAYLSEVLIAADIQPMVDAAARFNIIDRTFDAREIISPAVANLHFT
jgi:NitT/TauT family transport system substrate-binding protein